MDVLRKTPVKNKEIDHIEIKPKVLKPQNASENKLDISQVLSETTLPEIPSLPDEKDKSNNKIITHKSNDVFEIV